MQKVICNDLRNGKHLFYLSGVANVFRTANAVANTFYETRNLFVAKVENQIIICNSNLAVSKVHYWNGCGCCKNLAPDFTATRKYLGQFWPLQIIILLQLSPFQKVFLIVPKSPFENEKGTYIFMFHIATKQTWMKANSISYKKNTNPYKKIKF